MNITLSDINWAAVFPLGIISFFPLWLGYRRIARFFDHKNNSSKKERLLDAFLSTCDIYAAVFCFLMAIGPIKFWLVMIPFSLGALVCVIPLSILGSYYQLYFVQGYMPKNSGIKVSPGIRLPDAEVQNHSSFPSTHSKYSSPA
jgi:hypothetical protein